MSKKDSLQKYMAKIEDVLKKTLQELQFPKIEIQLEHPKEESHGDYSANVAFLLSKELKKSPLKIADEIVKKMKKPDFISDISVAAPGFINFTFAPEVFLEELQSIDEKYGSSEWGKGKKWSIEHTSPNPNKAMHIGHLRNNVIGMSLSKIWEYIGIEIVVDCMDNNRGIAITKLMWGFLKFAHKNSEEKTDISYWYGHKDEWNTPESLGVRPDKFVDDLYVKGAGDFSSSKESETIVRQMVVDWEAKDKKTWALWELVLKYSYQGQQMTLQRLGNRWDKIWHEHEHYQEGKDFVEEGLKKGIFRKLEDGVILTNLEKDYDLADTVVIKSDGTSLYITQDLSLTKIKKDTFRADKMFWVIGPEQSLALKQMFAVCEQLGIGKVEDFTHLSYGWMSIKGQEKMSSRLGNVIYIDDLVDIAKEGVLEKMKESNFPPEERNQIAEKVALAAVKYSILKVGRTMNIEFDMESSISFEGNSGPYIQYTFVRTKSILKRLETKFDHTNVNIAHFEKQEIDILRWVYRFGEVVEEAAKNYSPHLLCTYLFELAKRYNALYNELQILKEEDEQKRNLRLLITEKVGIILKKGMELLNIEMPERM
ncbi:arginine--tRNA ligase [Candidatus Peregrinibacteria bacterium]|nr:arginine--tRNA ligase [Candidatus Peregrinibacteria bacterium]